jgi:hypothetical protein
MIDLNPKYENSTVFFLDHTFGDITLTNDDVRKNLGEKNITFYEDPCIFLAEFQPLIAAVEVVNNRPVRYAGGVDKKISITKCAVIYSCSVKASFLKTAHPDHVLDGFIINNENFKKIADLTHKHAMAEIAYLRCNSWLKEAVDSLKTFHSLGIEDAYVSDLDFLEKIHQNYAVQALMHLHSEITQWASQNRWK